MSAALITSTVVAVVLLVALVAVAVLFLRALQSLVLTVDSMHARSSQQIENLCDRLMAIDYTTFHMARTEREIEDGGQVIPQDEMGSFVEVQLSDEELAAIAHERQLLTEDFPDDEDR
jgi:predicted PurR-regulated permease PerM